MRNEYIAPYQKKHESNRRRRQRNGELLPLISSVNGPMDKNGDENQDAIHFAIRTEGEQDTHPEVLFVQIG